MCPMAADAFTVHVSTGDGSSLHLLLIDQESKRYYCRTPHHLRHRNPRLASN